MESNRTRYTIKKLSINNRGIALFSAILISLMALVALAGLYFALTKLFGASQTIKTYSSVRDAAAGGVHYAIMIIPNLEGQDVWVSDDNPTPHSNPKSGDCLNSPINLRFKLEYSSSLFENKINICYLKYGVPVGFEAVGVAYSKEIPGNIGNTYIIISEAEGPEPTGQKTHSRIEAIYTK